MTTGPPVVTLDGGATMPLVGFGTWQLRGDQAYEATRSALTTDRKSVV